MFRAMAALSFDQEFQQQRQADMNRGGTDFATGMVSSAGHFASGVVSGVTGVFSRYSEGKYQPKCLLSNLKRIEEQFSN